MQPHCSKTVVVGEVAEWLMAPVLKTGIRETVSGVRIPPSPPYSLDKRESSRFSNRNILKTPVFRDCSDANRTGEKGPLSSPGPWKPTFLRTRDEQSRFESTLERMLSDHRSKGWRKQT